MNRRNNPQHLVRLANLTPELRPYHNGPQGGRPPCQSCNHLRFSLEDAHRQIADWNRWNESVKPILSSAKVEKASFNRKVLYLKSEINKREADLATKEKEFAAELKKRKDIICERGLQISHLQKCLQKKSTEPNKGCMEECMSVTARQEAEKETVSKLKQETLQGKIQIEEEWQKKVQMLEDQLSHKDIELLTLRREKEDLSEKLTETSTLLVNKDTELLQTKCDLEKFKKELTEKEKIWKASMKLMEEEKKDLMKLMEEEKKDLCEELTETSNLLDSKNTELLQTKCDLEKSKKELAEREDIWKASVKQIEEEKKNLQDLYVKEKEDLSERLTETSTLLDNKDTELLQTKCDLEMFKKQLSEREEIWKASVKQMEEEKKNLQDLYLKEKEDLSERLTETSTLLDNKDTELLQTKCDLEKSKKELAEREDIWKASVKQIEEEKKNLQDLYVKEKEDLSERLTETSTLLDNKDTELLQTKCDLEMFKKQLSEREEIWKASVKQMEEEKKNLQDLYLKEKEDLSKRLMETSNLLSSKNAELVQSQKIWQIKCDKLTTELAEKQEHWEARITQMEQEMKTLEELCLKKKKKKHFWSRKKEAKTETEKKENKQKEKEDQTEEKQQERKDKTKMKKGLWSWKHKKCYSDREVEEAAGCSGHTGQQ
ncbi:hypothetical protein PAMP_018129 [Pampus punctatissimus]